MRGFSNCGLLAQGLVSAHPVSSVPMLPPPQRSGLQTPPVPPSLREVVMVIRKTDSGFDDHLRPVWSCRENCWKFEGGGFFGWAEPTRHLATTARETTPSRRGTGDVLGK